MGSWTCVGTTDVSLPGQVDVATRVEVRVMRDPGHVLGPQMSHCLSKNNTDRINQLVR